MSKLTSYTENTSPVATDILYMVDDPGGSPLTQKITLANLGLAVPNNVQYVLVGGYL